jgi:hypothetical protein
MKKLLFAALLLTFTLNTVSAQEKVKFSKEQLKKMDDYLFDEAFQGASMKKTTTIILKDGTKLEGPMSDIDLKKGLINAIAIKDKSGKSQKYKSDEIAELYLPVSKLGKALAVNKYMSSSNNWGRKSLNKSTNPNEIYMKNLKTTIKNKKDEIEYLLQLVNPDFSNNIEVYADPRAGESGGMAFSPMGFGTTQTGNPKSFYIKKGDHVFWLQKSEFDDRYSELFGDNAEFMKKYPANSVKWEQFSFLVMEYTRLSEGA